MSFKNAALLSACLILAGCNAELNSLLERTPIEPPSTWQDTKSSESVLDNWLAQFNRDDLLKIVQLAMKDNLELKQLDLDVKVAEQELISAQSSFFPTLDFSFSQSRGNSTTNANPTNSVNLGLDLGYEVDLWGKLSDQEKQATQKLYVAKANYEQARQQLAADVATAWLDVIQSTKLLALYKLRIETATNNLAIIESGYEKGLNAALDVYLGRNDLDSELSRVANQQAIVSSNIRKLERFLGEYPKGTYAVSGDIPSLELEIQPGLPADLIDRKTSLAASWNNLRSKNAALAYAHKQRLPSLKLTSSIKDTAELPKNLFDGTALIWSLLGNLTAPIFDAGKLKSQEEIARLELRKAEYQYLSDVFDAYQNVENAITQENSLKRQFEATKLAEQNAQTALDLSFEQYQRGLVEYTTVLTSQSRLHDAQDSLLQLKGQLISNRITLHVALGGDFAAKQPKTETK